MPSSHPESSAFLLMGVAFSRPCSRFPLSPLRTWQRQEMSRSQLWHTASVTVGSSTASILLPAGAARHRLFTGQQALSRLGGNRSRSLSAWIGSGREQLRMWLLQSPGGTWPRKAGSFSRGSWPLRAASPIQTRASP